MSSSLVSSLDNSFERLNINSDPENYELTTIDYSRDISPIYSTTNNGGIWRVMALDPQTIVSASYDHLAKIWTPKENEKGTYLANIKVLKGHKREVLSLAKLSEDVFLTGSSDSTIHFWNTKDGSLLHSIKDKKNPTGFYSMKVIDNNIATGACQRPKNHYDSWEHDIKIWGISKRKFKYNLKGHTAGISEIVKLDENHIATSSGDSTIRVWDLVNRSTCMIFKSHEDYVYGLTKLGSSHLISASRDRSIRFFDVKAGKEAGQFSHTEDKKAHSSTVYDVNSLGNNIIASASRDGYVKIWDARNLKCIKMLDPDDGYVYSVNFSPDGKIFAGTSGKNCYNDANVVGWNFQKI